jgi:ubiquinone/menaquinone biosynthesis C-methylase UbiE
LFAENMAPMTGPLAGPLAAVALEGFNGPVHVLDIAAGHGLYGIEVAKQNPQAQITGLDWAAVLQVALKNAEKAGVKDRYTMLPGSAFDVEFGGPYDVVLLTNFLHHFDKPTNVGLLKKVRAALKPGGRVATLEFVPNEDRVSPPMPAAFAMTMLTSTADGDAYTLSELSAMYAEAGFKGVKAHAIPAIPQTIVVGTA